MTTRKFAPSAWMTAAAIGFAVLASCTRHDAASYVASADAYIAKADYKAAIIQLKNALQQAPDSGHARLLLARALLATGDPVGAETEVRKAIDYRASDDDTYPLLARSLVAQGKFADLLHEVGARKLGTPEARRELGVALATAHAGQGDMQSARSTLDAVLSEAPDDPRALLLEARLAAQSGDEEGARKFVATALAKSPDDVEALLASGQVELASGHRAEAQERFEKAAALQPKLLAPHYALVNVALQDGRKDAAREQVAKMKALAPHDGRTIYADALLAFAENDNARARDVIQPLLGSNPDYMPGLLLSGLVNERLGAYGAAEDALRTVVARTPNDTGAVRALAGLYLRTGRASQAVRALEPALRRTPDDPVLLRAAGEAYLSAGDATSAADAYERANKLDKSNVTSKVRLAQVRLAAGETERAFSDLESLTHDDSSQFQAELALFSAHLQRHEYDKALAAAAAIEKKQPGKAIAPFLRGSVYLAERDFKKARAGFEAALAAQPAFYVAGYRLALLDMQEGHPDAARTRLEGMLDKDPRNEELLLGYADLLPATGGSPEQVRAAIDKAIAAHPDSARARLALVRYLSKRNERQAAVDAAQAAVTALPNNVQMLEALGSVQLAIDPRQAVETFKRVVNLQPQNALAYVRLAEVQTALKDYESAIVNERKALALKSDLPQAYNALAKTYIASGQQAEAIAEARKLQKAQPEKAIGYALEGEILARQKKLPEAANAFRLAMSHEPNPMLATRAYVALQAANKPAEADALAKKWMNDHPKDVTIPLLQAQQDLQRRDLPAARAAYQRVLQIDANNSVALNNLAWVLGETNDPKAIEYAEQAHRIAPFNPSVMDTLGWALTRNGQAKRGLELLRMASAMAPGSADIRLHLAKAMIETGDKAGAREALAPLSKLDAASPLRAEAEKLLTTL